MSYEMREVMQRGEKGTQANESALSSRPPMRNMDIAYEMNLHQREPAQ
jgi:hypothetical protein